MKLNSDGTTTGSAATFNANIGSTLDGAVNAIVVLSNGQIVVGGEFTGLLKMFNPDGTTTGTAATFNTNVTGLLDFVYQGVLGLQRLSDNSIVVGGDFTGKLKLVNSDGTTTGSAATFNGNVGTTLGTTLYDYVNKMVVTTDGSIIAAGNFTTRNNTYGLRKFNANGTTDGSAGAFNTEVGLGVPAAVRAIVLDEANGAITIGGEASPYVRRFNLNGTSTGATTSSFNAAMTTRNWSGPAFSLFANSDGSVIIAGDGGDVQKFNLDGSLTGAAATFNTNSPYTTRVMSMVSVPGGGYLLGGGIYDGVGRLNTDGSTTGAAGTFNLNINGLIGSEVDAAVSFQGGILLGGYFDGNLRMINEDGSYTGAAASFNTNVGSAVGGQVRAIKVLANGKVLVGGNFTNRIKMFNADGTSTGAATTFNTNVASALNGAVNAIAELADGSVVVGGSFTNKLKMFNADGTTTGVAATFNTNVGSALDGTVKAVEVLDNGSVVVGGEFANRLMMFNADGTTTTTEPAHTFNTNVGSSLNSDVLALGLTSGGSLVAGGYFNGKLKMFNADGTTTGAAAVFNTNTSAISGISGVYNLSIARDDSIVAVGDITDYLKRVNADGTVTGDSETFNTNVSNILDYEAFATVFTSDGGVVVGCGCNAPAVGTPTTRNLYKFYGGGLPVGGNDDSSDGSNPTTTAPATASTTTVPATASTTTVPATASTTTVPANTTVTPTEIVINALPQAILTSFTITQGGNVSATQIGFTPGETVQLIVASTPRIIGTAVADQSGSVTITGVIPTDLEVGEHTIALYSPSNGFGYRQLFIVGAVSLPATGTNTKTPFVPILLLLIGGALVLTMNSRKRKYRL